MLQVPLIKAGTHDVPVLPYINPDGQVKPAASLKGQALPVGHVVQVDYANLS